MLYCKQYYYKAVTLGENVDLDVVRVYRTFGIFDRICSNLQSIYKETL